MPETSTHLERALNVNNVSNSRFAAARLMRTYQRLHLVTNANDVILFPVGMLNMPHTPQLKSQTSSYSFSSSVLPSATTPSAMSRKKEKESKAHATVIDPTLRKAMTHQMSLHHFDESVMCDHAPVIVFPLLRMEDRWTNGKPPTEYVEPYLRSLKIAVDVMNAARIAHLDLRPPNIMWKPASSSSSSSSLSSSFTSSEVEMKIIDLENALPFDSFLRFKGRNKNILSDNRYPFFHSSFTSFTSSSTSASTSTSSSTSSTSSTTSSPSPPPSVIGSEHNDWFLKMVSAWARQIDHTSFENFMTTTTTVDLEEVVSGDEAISVPTHSTISLPPTPIPLSTLSTSQTTFSIITSVASQNKVEAGEVVEQEMEREVEVDVVRKLNDARKKRERNDTEEDEEEEGKKKRQRKEKKRKKLRKEKKRE